MGEDEIVRVLAHLVLQEHHGWDSPLRRVYGPWRYSPPSFKLAGSGPPCEVWDRRLLEPHAAGVSVYRERPDYWKEARADEEYGLVVPFARGRDLLGAVKGTRVFWVCWHDFGGRGFSLRDIPRVPASSVVEAMRASEAALREAGGILAEDVREDHPGGHG